MTDPAHSTPAFFIGAPLRDSFTDVGLYDRAPHLIQIAGLWAYSSGMRWTQFARPAGAWNGSA
jgi:hypothetical protein